MAHYGVVVQRDRPALFETLAQTLGGADVCWDRRQAARRVTTAFVDTERRREDRRRAPPDRWVTGGCVVVAGREDERRMRFADLSDHGGQDFPPEWREAMEGMTEFRHRGYIIEAGAHRLASGEYAPRAFVRWETTATDHHQQLHDRQNRRAKTTADAIALATALGRAWIDKQHG